jgi:SAM-dependent methyltransferase
MTAGNTESIAAWTAVWQFEAAGNRPARPKHDLVIEPVWHEFIDSLADGTRILDLATGNGIVALSCMERACARRQRLEIDAVDAADIRPPSLSADQEERSSKVRFQGGVWLEDLPFGDGEFDAAVSQYGFEYADEEQAVSEAARVLAPGGRLRLVLHARAGALWDDIDLRHKRLNRVLAKDGVVSLVPGLLRAQQKNEVRTFKNRLKKLELAARETQKLAQNPPPDDSALFYSQEFLYVWSHRNQYQPDDLLRSLEDGAAFARGTAERYAQMLRVARSAEQIAALCERLTSGGLKVSAMRQIYNPADGREIAWQVDAIKKKGSG